MTGGIITTRTWLAMALLCLLVGCQLAPGKRWTPFSDPPATPATAAQPNSGLPGQSVVQAGFEQQARDSRSQYAGPPGVQPAEPESDKPFVERQLEKIEPKNLAKGFKKAIGQGPNEDAARKLQAEGDALFLQRRYDQAAAKYKSAMGRWPDSAIEEDCMFMYAESLFFGDRYTKAHDAYGAVLKKYENSRHLEKIMARQFAIGRYWDDRGRVVMNWLPNFIDKKRPVFDTRGNAIHAFETVRLGDPTGPLADDAIMATANSYFLRENYEDADYNYTLLRKEYAKSEHALQAHLLGVKAKMLAYQGAEYDEGPLVEAEQLVDITLTSYGQEIAQERERLRQTQNSIRQQKAEREWDNAEYYYRRKYHRAARYHYKALLDQYPDSVYAGRAQQRLEEITNLPDVPPNHFWWLAKVFGERERGRE